MIETREVMLEMPLDDDIFYTGEEFILPIVLNDLKGNSISSVHCKIAVDPDVLECMAASNIGTIAEGWTNFVYDCKANGEIWIDMSGVAPLSDTGTLIEIKYKIIADASGTSTIRIIDCTVNDGIPQVMTSSGLVNVEATSDHPSLSHSGQVILRNYPNPFSYFTTIEYISPDLLPGTRVILEVFNLNMVRVAGLVNHVDQAGKYNERWDGCDLNGNRLPSGIYIYRLKAGETFKYGRMMIVE
jgi:hypothetical protein